MRSRRVLGALASAALALGGGCGSDGEPAKTTSAEPVETAERAKLPRDWDRHSNFNAGVSFGLPPLWRAGNTGTTTTVHSPDRLLAITLSADRTREAIELDPGDFATRVARSLAGYRSIEPRPVTSFDHEYPAAAVEARGTTDRGIEQDVLVVVLDREGLVKVTALAAWNRARTPASDVRDAERMLRTIRTRPVA